MLLSDVIVASANCKASGRGATVQHVAGVPQAVYLARYYMHFALISVIVERGEVNYACKSNHLELLESWSFMCCMHMHVG